MIKIEDCEIAYDTRRFPDGSLSLKLPPIDNILEPHVSWYYEGDSELFTLICLRKHYADREMTLHMPYCPHARMDRVKEQSDVFTLKYFCEIINSLNFKMVSVNDVHSNVATALLDRVVNISPDKDIEYAIKSIPIEICLVEDVMDFMGGYKKLYSGMLFFPDEGAMKRYSGMFDLPYAYGIKKRNWETGKIEGLDVIGDTSSIAGKDILIVDDICSKGGTFLRSAKKLKELGARKIYLYVTHCENTILEGELLTSGLIEKVFTTDSIFTKNHEKIEVIKI